jgi:hypothetical protein
MTADLLFFSGFYQRGFHSGIWRRMGESTVSRIVHETCTVLWEELFKKFMPLPSKEQLESIEKDFYTRWKFPISIGCIDGKHCQLKCPVNSGYDFF